MKNILVAVDLELTDSLLLSAASAIAEKFESKLWIVHIAAPEPDFVGYDVGPEYIRETRAEELRDEHRKLQEYSDKTRELGLESDGLLIQGPTVEMIEQEIEKLHIDLLVIGSHRHGFLYETFVGSTPVKLIHNQTIPLLIVPLPD